MKTLFIVALLISSNAFAQGYYPRQDSGYEYIQRSPGGGYSNKQFVQDQMDRPRQQINRDMQELDVRSNIRRYEMINGGKGDGGYGRYDRY